jgi:hypothetical protein
MLAWGRYLDYMHPGRYVYFGFEIPLALVVGAILGVLEGSALGLLWAMRPPRMALWWLMLAVATVGLMLGLLARVPLLGLLGLTVSALWAILMKLGAILEQFLKT